MSLPEDERSFYEAAARANAEADQPPAPELSDWQRRYLQLVSHQAAQVVRDAPDLLAHLERMTHNTAPHGAANAGEVALFRQGVAHAVFTIRNAADWPGENDG